MDSLETVRLRTILSNLQAQLANSEASDQALTEHSQEFKQAISSLKPINEISDIKDRMNELNDQISYNAIERTKRMFKYVTFSRDHIVKLRSGEYHLRMVYKNWIYLKSCTDETVIKINPEAPDVEYHVGTSDDGYLGSTTLGKECWVWECNPSKHWVCDDEWIYQLIHTLLCVAADKTRFDRELNNHGVKSVKIKSLDNGRYSFLYKPVVGDESHIPFVFFLNHVRDEMA